MPDFRSAIRANRIPVIGLVPETSATAPATPTTGQLWNDTSVTPRLLKVYDGAAWTPVNIYAGTTAGSYAAGNDVRITGALQSANNLSELAGTAGTARTNLGLGTAATANTGTGVANVILGNDGRLSDQRTPTDASVTGGAAGAGVKIAASTITLANLAASLIDQAAGTASLRTLGTGATQALAGNTTLTGIGAPTADLSLANFKITNLGAPVFASDAARLADVQAAASGIDNKPSVRAATTANIALTGAQTIDGVAAAAGDRVLVKDQTAGTENGPYIVSAGAWTRAADTITPNSFWFVEEGTEQDNSQWMVTNNGAITLGTTTISISQFGAATSFTGGTGITVSASTISISTTYVGQTSITTLGTITTGTWNGTAIAVAFGGTGSTTAAGARTNLGAGRVGYAADLAAITAGTAVTVTHNLGTQDVGVFVKDTATQAFIEVDTSTPTANTVSIRTDVSFAASALRVIVTPAV